MPNLFALTIPGVALDLSSDLKERSDGLTNIKLGIRAVDGGRSKLINVMCDMINSSPSAILVS